MTLNLKFFKIASLKIHCKLRHFKKVSPLVGKIVN